MSAWRDRFILLRQPFARTVVSVLLGLATVALWILHLMEVVWHCVI